MGWLSDLFGNNKKTKVKGPKWRKDGSFRAGTTSYGGGKDGAHETSFNGYNGRKGKYEAGWHGDKYKKK